MTHKDALEILGLEADASLDEAKRAYRNLSLHYHPDRNPAPNASTMFRYIHDAWEYIQNDAKKRKQAAERVKKQAEAKRRAEEAERVKKQAREKRRAEAENALQQARAKRGGGKTEGWRCKDSQDIGQLWLCNCCDAYNYSCDPSHSRFMWNG